MEIGLYGVHGQLAPNLVEEEFKLIPEIVAVQSPLMVDLIVVAMQQKHRLVIVRHVQQVNMYFLLFLFQIFFIKTSQAGIQH
jgi:hypothetical protein